MPNCNCDKTIQEMEESCFKDKCLTCIKNTILKRELKDFTHYRDNTREWPTKPSEEQIRVYWERLKRLEAKLHSDVYLDASHLCEGVGWYASGNPDKPTVESQYWQDCVLKKSCDICLGVIVKI